MWLRRHFLQLTLGSWLQLESGFPSTKTDSDASDDDSVEPCDDPDLGDDCGDGSEESR